jgi:hypothetical protein
LLSITTRTLLAQHGARRRAMHIGGPSIKRQSWRCFCAETAGKSREQIREGEFLMLLLVLLALLTIIAFGVGFTVHWLFVVAVVLAVIWLISLLTSGIGGRSRGAWW